MSNVELTTTKAPRRQAPPGAVADCVGVDMPKRIAATCLTCGSEFETRKDRPQRYCCRDCWKTRGKNPALPPVKRARLSDPVQCRSCNESFVRSRGFIKYCDTCRASWRCKRCDAQLRMAEQNFCGFECRSRYMVETGQMPLEAMAEGRRKGKRPRVPVYLDPRTCKGCGITYSPRSAAQDRCKTCIPNKVMSALARRYGLTVDQLIDMRKAQNSQCAICSRDLPDHGHGRGVVVDHCHDTGRVRGLLCISCNGRLSGLEDKDWRKKALDYLGDADGTS